MTQRVRLTDDARRVLTQQPFYPTDEQRALVRRMTSLLATEAEICELIINPATGLPISVPTMRTHFAEERKQGAEEANQKVSRALFQKAVGREAVLDANNRVVAPAQSPDTTAAIWWEKSRLGYKEGQTVEHTGPGGEPLSIPTPTVVVMLPHNGRDELPAHRATKVIDQQGNEVQGANYNQP